MATQLRRAFKSENHRLRQIQEARDQPWFTCSLEFDQKSIYLDFKFEGKEPQFTHRPKKIYENKDTHTWVYRCRGQNGPVIKIYKIKGRAQRHNIEARYLRIFAEFVQRRISPHFTLPLGRSLVPAEIARSLVREEELPDGTYQVLMSESALASLWEFAHTHRKQLTPYVCKVLLFQTFFTLKLLAANFTSFRHNDLHIGNVLLQQLAPLPYCTAYETLGQTFYHDLERCPYRILLWDMYFSSINEEDAASLRDVATAPRKVNPYYDVHKLVDSVDYMVQQCNLEDPELKEFLAFALPEEYKCRTKNLSRAETQKLNLIEVRHVTLEEILGHSYFQELCTSYEDIYCTYEIERL